MIEGIGLDVIDIDRIKNAYKKKPRFADRILTMGEYQIFRELSGHRQIEFLAGRFAVKEAFSKALGTGLGKVKFSDIEVLKDETSGKPYVSNSPYSGKCFVSITHTSTVAVAQVILERE